MAHFYGMVRLKTPEDWKGLAGGWSPGKSAYELAYSWQSAGGFPAVVSQALDRSSYDVLHGLRLDVGLVEKPVFLDTLKGPSMTDIMGYARNRGGQVVVAGVEGKANEAFSTRVVDWVRGDGEALDSVPRPTRLTRLRYLSDRLGFEISEASRLRYQLLHRTVSVISEAQLHGAAAAVVIVHSFAQGNDLNWSDYKEFLIEFDIDAVSVGAVAGPVTRGEGTGIPLFFLWVEDDPVSRRGAPVGVGE